MASGAPAGQFGRALPGPFCSTAISAHSADSTFRSAHIQHCVLIGITRLLRVRSNHSSIWLLLLFCFRRQHSTSPLFWLLFTSLFSPASSALSLLRPLHHSHSPGSFVVRVRSFTTSVPLVRHPGVRLPFLCVLIHRPAPALPHHCHHVIFALIIARHHSVGFTHHSSLHSATFTAVL